MTTGVIIARFQINTPHTGHHALIKAALERHKRLIIFLGVSAVHGRKNPLNYEIRKDMVKSLYPQVEIYPLYDNSSNDDWVLNFEKIITDLVPNQDVILYGSRDSCIETYLKHGGKHKTEIIPQEEYYNATQIRDEISKNSINNDHFRAGIIYGQYNNNYPTAFPTVDVIATRIKDNEIEILLGQKETEIHTNLWRIPGGFIDPTDNNGRIAASRELREETCLHASTDLFKIIDQVKVYDWRYRGSENGIMTTIYTIHFPNSWHDKIINNNAVAGDDLKKVQWFKVSEIFNVIRPLHKPCIETYLNSNEYQELIEKL